MTRAALALLVCVASAATAAPVVVGDFTPRWRVDLPDGWRAEEPPEVTGGSVMASWLAGGGRRLVVARLRGNTDAAYAGDATFFSKLEEGVRRDTEGYRRLSARRRTFGERHKIPGYDLWYRTKDGVRGTRFVIMRGYAVMATLEAPRARKVDAAARKIVESFEPVW